MNPIFQQIIDGLRQQGRPAYNPEMNRCFYRTHTGLKCAVGQLIPDDKYKPEFDEGGGMNLRNKNIIEAAGVENLGDIDFDRLVRAQRLHDNYARRNAGKPFDTEFFDKLTNLFNHGA